MPNYYVDPLGGFNLGQGLTQAVGLGTQIADRREQKAMRDAAIQGQQNLADQFQSAWEAGDADTIYKLSAANPEFQKAFEARQKHFSDQTKNARRNALQQMAMGEDPVIVAGKTAEFIESQGGDATNMRNLERMAMEDPEAARKQAEMLQAAQFSDDFKGLMEYRKAQSGEPLGGGQTANIKDLEYYKQLKKTDPESAKAFGISKGYISKEGIELSSHLQKRLSEASDEAIKSDNNVRKFEVLASEIEKSDIKGGIFGGKWGEALKDITGSQDSVTELRKQYNAIRASQVVNNLPPGAASDTDIALALSGFPSENANKEQLSSFLRGISKLEKLNAEYNTFKADYISDNGSERGMLKAWKDKTPVLSDEELLEKYG